MLHCKLKFGLDSNIATAIGARSKGMAECIAVSDCEQSVRECTAVKGEQ